MAKDAASLLAQANCYACFGIGGTFDVMEVSQIARWAASLNKVPNGAVYNASSQNVVGIPPLSNGLAYRVVFGPNEVSASITNSTGTFVVTAPNFVTFMANNTTTITFTGKAPGLPVTASVVQITNLISAQFYNGAGQYTQAITIGKQYTVTLFGPNDSVCSSGTFSLTSVAKAASFVATASTINFTGGNSVQVTAVLSSP